MAVRMHKITQGKFHIVIMDAPLDDEAAAGSVGELRALGVTDVVRTCDPTYSAQQFEREGLQVHEMMFADGAAPPEDVLVKWNALLCEKYRCKGKAGLVAVHCGAGLGRAPVMAAVALIEMKGMDPVDVVEKIRATNKGAINVIQFRFLQAYKRRSKAPSPCAVM
mmetsp:Transcript_127296/g.360220  ORF Transcript_127296/g.360220 Transcript_127296/m.360220 type:complete len:165 (+) Transcript_127296:118-612(+)